MTVTMPPYEAKIPRDDRPAGGWLTAEQELAAALEGQGPHLAKDLAKELGPDRTARLAQVVRRAVAVGIKRRADEEAAKRIAGAYELLVDGLEHVDPECVSPEAQPARVCRICQCTDEDGCLIHEDGRLTGVCTWVEADLCSECQPKAATRG
jgi:hypothetical protein